MGWWSVDVLGGDTPLDNIASMEKVIGVGRVYPVSESYWEENHLGASVKTAIESNLEKLSEWCKPTSGEIKYDDKEGPMIRLQVLGVVAMAAGAKIPAALKKQIVSAARNDPWAQEDGSRREAMDNLVFTINAYQGKPVFVNSRGLFEMMSKSFGNKPLM